MIERSMFADFARRSVGWLVHGDKGMPHFVGGSVILGDKNAIVLDEEALQQQAQSEQANPETNPEPNRKGREPRRLEPLEPRYKLVKGPRWRRDGLTVGWSKGNLVNKPGDDLIVLESGYIGLPEAFLVRFRRVGGSWTAWYYQAPKRFDQYNPPFTGEDGLPAGTFLTVFDLSDVGLDLNQAIEAVQVVNLRPTDRLSSLAESHLSGPVFLDAGQKPAFKAQDLRKPWGGPVANFNEYPPDKHDPEVLWISALRSPAPAPPGQEPTTPAQGPQPTRPDAQRP
jgi:hypothetical protein